MTSPVRGHGKCETVSARGSQPTISGVNFPAMKSFNGGYGIGWIILLHPPLVRGEGWGEVKNHFDYARQRLLGLVYSGAMPASPLPHPLLGQTLDKERKQDLFSL